MSSVPKSPSPNDISLESTSSFRQISSDAPSVELRFDRPDELSVSIDPSEWRLHHERQKLQLLAMLSQIARYQDLISRLTNLTSGLDMSDTVSHLNDVGQRITEINLRLLSLKNAYETIYNLEDASDEYKASQLKDLRGFLISLGRSLEMTKECFFTIAGIIKGALQNQSDNEPTQPSEELCKTEVTSTAPARDKIFVLLLTLCFVTAADASTSESKSSQSTAVAAAVEQHSTKSQQEMELTISQLSEQRDRLIKQLAEARAKVNGIDSSPPKVEDTSKSKTIFTYFISPLIHSSRWGSSDVAPAEGGDDSLPILKRLQARKEHLEQLRGELHSFDFSNSDEVSPLKASTSRPATSSASIKASSYFISAYPLTSGKSRFLNANYLILITTPSSRSRTSNRSEENVANQSLDDRLDESLPTTFSGLELSTPPSTLRSNQLVSIASSDSDPTTQKGEAVTFQEPEATYLDNTERLYKSMREARIWREEHRNTSDIPLDSSIVATSGDKGTDEGDDKVLNGTNRSYRSCTGEGGGLSESASCMDATAMATWGGSSNREEEEDGQNVGEEEEYTEDIPSVVSSRSRRFLNSSMSSSTHRECLGIRTTTESRESSSGIGMRMPHLGHSPSPRNSDGKRTTSRPSAAQSARNSLPYRRQTERFTIQSNSHNDTSNISLGGSASDIFLRGLAEKMANLEFKLEQLTQTCNLLVTENARMSSYFYSAQQNRTSAPLALHQPQCTADWSFFSSPPPPPPPQQQPLLTISTSGLFASPYRPPAESLSGLSSVHSLAPAPPTPTLQHGDKYTDQIQILAAEVIEQRSRMNQLQNKLQAALQQQQQSQFVAAAAADIVVQPSTYAGAPTNGIHRGQTYSRSSLTNFFSPLAMQAAAQLQATSDHITGGGANPRTPN
ncbi:unnamed protein product [Rodentolepis nana]|uniref:PH domain-containing protein n=1 Tax=Rodentolepis nana TaxID=102285 RepID=A0A158QHL7_RODNA|nr:unnamed protein product [Rodentolepis nana]